MVMCVLIFLACEDDNGENNNRNKPVNVGENVKGQLLILQAFGTGENGGRAVDRNFIELYNKSDKAINLKGASLWYADGSVSPAEKDGPWKMIELDGIIPAKGSFLVVGEAKPAVGEVFHGLKIPDGYGDIYSPQFLMSNDSFKVALLYGFTVLTDEIQNPFNTDGNGKQVAGYLDMVGARNSTSDQIFGFETAPARNSRSEAVRRKNLNDTDNNQGYHATRAPYGTGDFISIRYAELTEGEREVLKPRSTEAGSWSPFQEPASVSISNVAANLPLGINMTLSALFTPFNADTTDLNFTWTVTNQNPADVITFDVTNKDIFSFNAAKPGTATVNLSVNGGVLTSNLTSTITLNVIAGSEMLMIMQANGYGNDNNSATGSGFPRSAVELYNNTNSAIDLTAGNYYLHIGNAITWTNAIKLAGVIPAKSSFLIISNNGSAFNPTPRAAFPPADQEADFNFSNNGFKVAIMRNQAVLTVDNPFTESSLSADFVDLLGASAGVAVNAFKGNQFIIQSRPRIPRRNSLVDTNDNRADYIDVDTRRPETGNPVSNADLYKVWPRNSSMGQWNPMTGEPPVHPVPSPHL